MKLQFKNILFFFIFIIAIIRLGQILIQPNEQKTTENFINRDSKVDIAINKDFRNHMTELIKENIIINSNVGGGGILSDNLSKNPTLSYSDLPEDSAYRLLIDEFIEYFTHSYVECNESIYVDTDRLTYHELGHIGYTSQKISRIVEISNISFKFEGGYEYSNITFWDDSPSLTKADIANGIESTGSVSLTLIAYSDLFKPTQSSKEYDKNTWYNNMRMDVELNYDETNGEITASPKNRKSSEPELTCTAVNNT